MDLIAVLKRFNRKERFHLLHHALGYEGESFRLGEKFRKALGANIDVRVPPDAIVMMDYHLDWISMAVWLAGRTKLPTKQVPVPNEGRVAGNQEDVDLLVAFRSKGTAHLVLVEAKGNTPWSDSQLRSKAKRLSTIFGDEIAKAAKLQPHFVLISPTESSGIDPGAWPCWMRAGVRRQMVLPWPITMKPTRCDENGKAESRGTFIRIDATKGGGT